MLTFATLWLVFATDHCPQLLAPLSSRSRECLTLFRDCRSRDAVGPVLVDRIDELTQHDQRVTEQNRQFTRDNERLRQLVTELEDDLAAARTSLRRMIRDTNQPDTDQPQENP